jgi:hypothetical protein
MVAWTVGLAVTLPHRYVVDTWTVTWASFDVALMLLGNGLGTVEAAPGCLAACDGHKRLVDMRRWFDLPTAHRGGDLLVSTASALFGEIPLAIFLAAISTRLLRATMRIDQGSAVNTPVRSLWHTPLITATNRSTSVDPSWRVGPARRR